MRSTAALLMLFTVGCGGVAQSPVAPSPTSPVIPSPPPIVTPPGPHFALVIYPPTGPLYDDELWNGIVAVEINPSIIRPELPMRVITTCGTRTQIHDLGEGTTRFYCMLPAGVHTIGAVAEMTDGRRYSRAVTATVLARPK